MEKQYYFNTRLGKGDEGKQIDDDIKALCSHFNSISKTALFKMMIANEKNRVK